MIEVKFIKEQPQITINKNKLNMSPKLYNGCADGETRNPISLSEIENIDIDTIPNNVFVHIILESDENQNYYFGFINILRTNNNFFIELIGCINSLKWNIEYFNSFFESKFFNIFDKTNNPSFSYDGNFSEFSIRVHIDKYWHCKNIGNILKYLEQKIDFIYKDIINDLSKEIIEESETVFFKFNFPKHLKDICKQYLYYFRKFLSDNNVDCDLNLIDKDDITYMTINVDESKIDIEKLKQALVGYFTLPIVKQENISFETYNIATQQLIANIEHLRSQLRLANLTITQYENNSLATSPKPVEYVLIDSLDEESNVKLFDGLVEIGKTAKFKFFGIEIGFSIPKLIDKFKKSSEDMK